MGRPRVTRDVLQQRLASAGSVSLTLSFDLDSEKARAFIAFMDEIGEVHVITALRAGFEAWLSDWPTWQIDRRRANNAIADLATEYKINLMSTISECNRQFEAQIDQRIHAAMMANERETSNEGGEKVFQADVSTQGRSRK